MPMYYERIESRLSRAPTSRNADHWGAAVAGSILFALPVAGGFHRGSFGWIEVVVAVIGIAGLVTAAEALMHSRPRSSSEASRSAGRHTACPRSGEFLREAG